MAARVNWRQAFAEVALLLSGAALALAVDGWADAREARLQEQAHLSALQTDFEATRSQFVDRLRFGRDQEEHNQRLIELLGSEGRRVPQDSVVALLQLAFVTGQPAPIPASFQDLVGSGSMSLITNAALRREMTRLVASMESSQWFFDEAIRHYSDQVSPYFTQHLSVPAIYSGSVVQGVAPYAMGSGVSQALEPDALWNGRLRNLVATQSLYIASGNRSSVLLLEQLDSVLALIARETHR